MKRQLESIEIDGGAWLRLDCGHPAPTDGCVECVLCDRGQLPAGLIADGAPRRHGSPWPQRCRYELTPPAWAILTVEAGAVALTGHGSPCRTLAATARVVLVAGARYRIEPSPDAAFTIQKLRHPSRASLRPHAVVDAHR